ncbi:MAG: gamma-glutamyl-gamma-aminobutyrate hydrolase family protein [Bacteroidales bacterium]|jgi:putative glutamine amidotransferase
MRKLLHYSLFVLFIGSCISANGQPLILISKDYNGHIQEWMQDLAPDNNLRICYDIPQDSLLFFLEQADGMIIGGGRDVHPDLYGKPDYVSQCGSFDRFRDSLELRMIEYAMTHKIPLLGICRGHQILNVALGGTLVPDIPTAYPESNIRHRRIFAKAHVIHILPGSWLADLPVQKRQKVNSRHHQCIDLLAPGFRVAALSPDSIIESIEYIDAEHPFAIGVQWHPESLRNSLSMAVGRAFLQAVEAP